MPRADSSRLTLLSIRGKNGSEKIRALSSQTMKAIDPVPRDDDARGARLRTYPRSAMAASTCCRVSGRTRADPVSTRDAVAGETPAAARQPPCQPFPVAAEIGVGRPSEWQGAYVAHRASIESVTDTQTLC